MIDFVNLDKSLRKDIETIGGEKIVSNFKKLDILLPYLTILNGFPLLGGTKLRKLVYFPEKEDKVRVVAILDYFSQTVLRPLHLYLFRVLRKIPQDCTFKQESFIDKIKDWTYFASADLTAATDRFPLRLITEVLGGRLPPAYIEAFTRILVERPFVLQDRNTLKERELKYSTGNPMGAYASWSSFTLSHHYVMYYCCRELKIPYHTAKYCMLGDDIVIGDERLATLYIDVMLDLGVDINLSKTHKSLHFCEFAKRLIYRGTDITPFPISALKETSKRYFTLTNLFMEWESKGYQCANGISATIYSYYEFIKPVNSKTRTKWRDGSRFCEVITKVMSDTLPTNDALNGLIREFGYRIRELRLEECESIFSNIAVEMFAESNPVNTKTSKKGAPLGVLPLWIVQHLSGLEIKILEWIGFDFSCIPLLFCYGKIEENFISLSKLARHIDTVGGGAWPKSLTTMAVPLSDSVLMERVEEPINVTGSKIAEHLRYRFEILQSPLGSTLLA
nr:MAG: RNA dependent RNA polymerase [Mitoviridae sp.]